jgi:hypothetical protein
MPACRRRRIPSEARRRMRRAAAGSLSSATTSSGSLSEIKGIEAADGFRLSEFQPILSQNVRRIENSLVPGAGLEPAWNCFRGILSPLGVPLSV